MILFLPCMLHDDQAYTLFHAKEILKSFLHLSPQCFSIEAPSSLPHQSSTREMCHPWAVKHLSRRHVLRLRKVGEVAHSKNSLLFLTVTPDPPSTLCILHIFRPDLNSTQQRYLIRESFCHAIMHSKPLREAFVFSDTVAHLQPEAPPHRLYATFCRDVSSSAELFPYPDLQPPQNSWRVTAKHSLSYPPYCVLLPILCRLQFVSFDNTVLFASVPSMCSFCLDTSHPSPSCPLVEMRCRPHLNNPPRYPFQTNLSWEQN